MVGLQLRSLIRVSNLYSEIAQNKRARRHHKITIPTLGLNFLHCGITDNSYQQGQK